MAAPLARHKKIDTYWTTGRSPPSLNTTHLSKWQDFGSFFLTTTVFLFTTLPWHRSIATTGADGLGWLPNQTSWWKLQSTHGYHVVLWEKHGSDIDCKSAVSEKTASTLRLNKPRILQRAFGHISNRRSSQWMCFNPRAQASICLYIYSLIYSDISMSLYLIIFIHVRICVCMYVCMDGWM